MKEVIEAILEDEKKAREHVEAARQEAKDMRLKAEEKTGKIVSKAKDEAQIESKTLLENARINAEKEKTETLKKAAQASELLWEEKSDRIQQIIDHLFLMITKKPKI